jgi:hypothetical protein
MSAKFCGVRPVTRRQRLNEFLGWLTTQVVFAIVLFGVWKTSVLVLHTWLGLPFRVAYMPPLALFIWRHQDRIDWDLTFGCMLAGSTLLGVLMEPITCWVWSWCIPLW